MPTKASSPTKNKGKVFFVAKSSGPLLGRLPLTFPAQLSMSFTRPLKNKGFDLIMATFQKLITVNVSIGLKGNINHV